MPAEITDKNANTIAGWIFYDAECRLCVAARRRWGPVFERRGFVWLPLQTPGAAERLGVSPERLGAQMWLLPGGGSPRGGVAAWIGLMRHVWWLRPLAVALGLPVIQPLAGTVYRWIARHRHGFGGHCPARSPPAKKNRHSAFFELP